MRAGVVFFAEKKKSAMIEIARGLAKGLEAAGHRVDIIDGLEDSNVRLTMFEYIAVGCESLSFFTGRISDRIPSFLANSGMISGKRSFAFAIRHPFSARRALSRVMKCMEKEGMYLKFSDVLLSASHAESVGRNL